MKLSVCKRKKPEIHKIPVDMSKASPPLDFRNATEETRLKISGSPDLSVLLRPRESEKERARAARATAREEKGVRWIESERECVRESE